MSKIDIAGKFQNIPQLPWKERKITISPEMFNKRNMRNQRKSMLTCLFDLKEVLYLDGAAVINIGVACRFTSMSAGGAVSETL